MRGSYPEALARVIAREAGLSLQTRRYPDQAALQAALTAGEVTFRPAISPDTPIAAGWTEAGTVFAGALHLPLHFHARSRRALESDPASIVGQRIGLIALADIPSDRVLSRIFRPFAHVTTAARV